jgi:hypothetical protein
MWTTRLPPRPAFQALPQGNAPFECVEVEDGLPPLRVEQPGDLGGNDSRTRRNDQRVVAEDPAVGRMHGMARGVDAVDLRDHEVHARGDEFTPGSGQLRGGIAAERQEQQPGLVQMDIVAVDQGNLHVFPAQPAAEPIRYHCASRSGAENNEMFHGVARLEVRGCGPLGSNLAAVPSRALTWIKHRERTRDGRNRTGF